MSQKRWMFILAMLFLATLQHISSARKAIDNQFDEDEESSARSLQGVSLGLGLSLDTLLGFPCRNYDDDNDNSDQQCVPVKDMSVTADTTRWWPYTLKQFESGSTRSCFPDRTYDKATGVFNSEEAYVTVLKPGAKPWHIQLSSAPAVLEAGYYYTLMYRAKSNVTASMQVALVQVDDCSCNWKVAYVSQPQTTTTYKSYTTINLTPPVTTKYLLNFDLALAKEKTTFSFDDIMLCKQPFKIKVSPEHGTLLPEASEDFGGSDPNYAFQLAAGKAVPALRPGQGLKGSTAATVTILKAGTEPWHIQLAGKPVYLRADKKYFVELALKQVGAKTKSGNRPLVTWVEPDTWVAVSVESLQLTDEYQVFTLPIMSPPKDGRFYLTVDMGLLDESSTVSVDYVKVYQL